MTTASTDVRVRFGHRYTIGSLPAGQIDRAFEEIRALPDDAFDEYDNPFERKCTLRDKFGLPRALERLIEYLEGSVREKASNLFKVWGDGLQIDTQRHYAGVFRYRPGDHLGVHVDAGIHPVSKLRKHVTAVLYLGTGDGALELWNGDHCVSEGPGMPKLYECVDRIEPQHGRLVLFENNDYAWHGVTRVEGNEPRYVVTVSYVSQFVSTFGNMRRRAFFVPRPEEDWDAETYELRDVRADPERFSEAYRVM